ncbi:hypothetical protein V2J09_009626 [Rumex salicifolius]
MALQLRLQNQTPNQIPQLAVTTDLSLATPGSPDFKRPKRCLEESPTKIIMSNGKRLKLELKLGLSPNRAVGLGRESPTQSIESLSPPSSCVSSENSQDVTDPGASMMVVVGCPRCLMYVMISDDVDSKCPWCKSHVLLDVVKHSSAASGTVAGVTARGGAKRVRKS